MAAIETSSALTELPRRSMRSPSPVPSKKRALEAPGTAGPATRSKTLDFEWASALGSLPTLALLEEAAQEEDEAADDVDYVPAAEEEAEVEEEYDEGDVIVERGEGEGLDEATMPADQELIEELEEAEEEEEGDEADFVPTEEEEEEECEEEYDEGDAEAEDDDEDEMDDAEVEDEDEEDEEEA